MEQLQTRYALQKVDSALAAVFDTTPRLKPSAWVETYRKHSGEANARTHGRWRNFPMQVEPMDSVVDPEVRETCLMWAAQTAGKTEVLNGICGYFIHQEPSPQLMVQPDLNLAEAWSKDRIGPFIRNTSVLSDLVDSRSRRSGNTILHKTYPGGHLTVAGANSPASLASRPIRVNLFDEVDRFPATAGKEGDPADLAKKRSDTFPNSVCFYTSTPTVAGHSRIEKLFSFSDKRYWFVRCPECEHEQTLKWAQVKWKDDASTEDAYYLCENKDCNAQWNDHQRVEAVKRGRWIATAPFRGIRGYHLNGIYSLHRAKKGFKNRLHQFVEEFLLAKRKGKESLKVWVNTFLAETWSEETDVKPSWRKLYDRRTIEYNPLKGPIPNGVKLITFGTDFQADRIELEFIGWGEGEESWGLGKHTIWGDTRLPEIYQRMESLLIKEFTRVDGCRLTANAGGFDTGYAACQRQLYAWLRPRLGRRYYAFKGSSQKNAEPISHSAKSKVDIVRLIIIGTNRIKSYIYARATITATGPGYMHIPNCEGYEEEWFKQLLSEDPKTEVINGIAHKVFTMPTVTEDDGTDRNEALDIRVYAHGALYARGVPNWSFEERRLQAFKTPEGDSPAPTREELPRKLKRKRRVNSFMSNLLG